MRPLKLEVFATERDHPDAMIVMEGSNLEDLKLASYEQGYAAGWDDSAAAQAEDQRKVRADLAHNLQVMSFTYHEARGHILRAIAPLLQDITTRLMPQIMREALAPIVLDTLMPLAEAQAGTPITIVMNPASRPAIESLLDQASGLPVTLRDEPSLGEGQVFLQLGETETRIDLDRASEDITAAVRGFFDLAQKERKYG